MRLNFTNCEKQEFKKNVYDFLMELLISLRPSAHDSTSLQFERGTTSA